MAVHQMQLQLLFVRPHVAKFGARALPMTKRAAEQVALVRVFPTARTAAAKRTTHLVAVGALGMSIAALSREYALCQQVIYAAADGASGSGPSKKAADDGAIDKMLDFVLAQSGDITLAGGLGFCSGFALKQAGKVAAITIGGLFLLAQIASSKGYIDINWKKVEKDVVNSVDADGDGKITKKDIKIWVRQLLVMLQHKLPSSAGFSAGFVLGVKCS